MKRLIFSLIIAAHAVFAVAQPMTLEQCRVQALEHNKSLDKARWQIKKQEADLKAMKTNFLPNFNLFGADLYNTSKLNFTPNLSGTFATGMAGVNTLLSQLAQSPTFAPIVAQLQGLGKHFQLPDDFFEFKTGNVFMGGVSVYEPLYLGGKITAGYKMNQRGLQMAKNNVRLTESEVILNTDEAYVLCIRAKELGVVARSYQALLEELKKNVDAAVNQGMRTRNDALKVQVKLNEAALNIMKADNAYRLAQMNLAQIIGLPLIQQIEVTSEGFPASTEGAVPDTDISDVSKRPEYDLLNDKTELARLQVKLTRSDFLPNVLVFGSYSYMNGMKLLGEKLFKNGSATVGVALKVPLFHFGEGTQKVRSAKAAWQIAQLEQEDLTEKMRLEAMQASNNLHEALMEIDVTQKSVEQATENMKMSRQQYEVGTEPLSDYLEAQAMWQQAKANAVEARCAYLIAHTKYLKAIGAL